MLHVLLLKAEIKKNQLYQMTATSKITGEMMAENFNVFCPNKYEGFSQNITNNKFYPYTKIGILDILTKLPGEVLTKTLATKLTIS